MRDILKESELELEAEPEEVITSVAEKGKGNWKWSLTHKGKHMELSLNNTRVVKRTTNWQGIRSETALPRGRISEWKVRFYENGSSESFHGVISSEAKAEHFDGSRWWNLESSHAFGIWTDQCISRGSKRTEPPWPMPSFPRCTANELRVVADYRASECLLSVFWKGKLMGADNQSFTLKLPRISDEEQWFPAVQLGDEEDWCEIESV